MYTYKIKPTSLALALSLLIGCSIKKVSMDLPQPLSEFKNQQQVENKSPEGHIKPTQVPSQNLATLEIDRLPTFTKQQLTQFELPKEKISINVDAMPLNEFIHLALGDILGLSFEVDEQVSKKKVPVTLHVSKPIKAKRLLGMIEQLLGAYDVFLAESVNGLRVIPLSKAPETIPSLISEQDKILLHAGRIMTIIPLNYIKAQEAVVLARNFLKSGKTSMTYANRQLNAVIVIGFPERVAAYKQAIKLIDRSGFVDKKMMVIRPIYWQAEELGKELEKLLAAQNIPINKNNNNLGVNILIIEQNNSLVLVSTEKKWISLLQQWVEALDTVDAVGEENNSYIYFVRNSKAKSLGEVISSVLGGEKSTTSKTEDKEEKKGQEKNLVNNKAKVKQPKNIEKTGISSIQGIHLRVTIDEERNLLIFTGTARAYRGAYNLLKQLDREPRQVLIEATVADISIDDSLALGIDWAHQKTEGNNEHLVGTFDGLKVAAEGIALAAGGLSYSFLNKAAGIVAQIRALAVEGNAKILSSPRLLTKDNEEASIQVGQQVSVVGSEVSNVQAGGGNNANLLRSFNYVDTGVILTVKPTILDAGKVELAITQEVSKAGPSNNNTPTINTRKVKTVLVAESGQTIMIGGLITHDEVINETKVPLLGDIPWLGYLFSKVTRADRVTNMVILITPHVISTTGEAVYLTQKFQEEMLWLNDDFSDRVNVRDIKQLNKAIK